MDTRVHDLLVKLSAVEPLRTPEGERGAPRFGMSGGARYMPVLSVYLDWRPEATGERPGVRAARVILRDRLHEIERALWPRGAAYDSVQADVTRIQRYLDDQASASAEGVAVFACGPLGLFETLEAGVPFETEVVALATPNLYQLARLLDDQETVVVALMDSVTARLFVSQRGLLRELKRLSTDPKFFSMIKGAVAMEQAHYQRYALTKRARFAEEIASALSQLVKETGAKEVILAGEEVALATLRPTLAPEVARLVTAVTPRMDMQATPNDIREVIEPITREVEAEQEHSEVERLLSETLAGRLGVAGLHRTRAALEMGQVNTLLLLVNAPLSAEERSDLIALATNTGADTQIVESSPGLEELGGVGALLRYKLSVPPRPVTISAPEPPGAQPTA
ncbi:MAG TPA: host attachment protein [Ktedonobacterales bacterium]|jgi:peptide subunit release factor 1 (eRF1)|nr:host attachment protein [Ktedonobacterales bacterium]